ncbi:hypothetical protein BCV72DRAFT_303205 [Rhizopus microsporus var. microsporus]|uniref:Uncharacterized protein n=2 Tax=Rhizopus microsporus TaxID=58291 RepID=A0A2G4T5U9_RHIZD|nr:uncharacterized protein RHIMIDRAFT_233981 [Rhizopus microsporus ATCC 52813]ORE08989.1 hypothetical protein BCV72DRAFT_303205 [Rhizopus microsporus var. microsporus]PHZ16381.1 hypothetical protein RHIMIDRAFT_233981 [Rhizopus microsporus ATCC 52813]
MTASGVMELKPVYKRNPSFMTDFASSYTFGCVPPSCLWDPGGRILIQIDSMDLEYSGIYRMCQLCKLDLYLLLHYIGLFLAIFANLKLYNQKALLFTH